MSSAFFDIDLLGSYHQLILSKLSDSKQDHTAAKTGDLLAIHLKKTFDPMKCLIHIDGQRPIEKQKAHEARDKAKIQELKKLDSNLRSMESKSLDGKWTSGAVVKAIKRSLRRIFHITEDKTITIDGVQLDRVPVSTDSDYIVYPTVDKLLRKMGETEFNLYTKERVLQALDLPSASHLASKFNKSSKVFLDMKTTSAPTKPTNISFNLKLAKFNELKDLRAKCRPDRDLALSTSPPFYVADGSTRNQFRPIFETKESIFSGKTYEDITTAQPRVFPAKKRPPGLTPVPLRTMDPPSPKKKNRNGQRRQTTGGAKRTLNPSTVEDRELRKRHPIRTLSIGCLNANLKRQGMGEEDARRLWKQLERGVDLSNLLQMYAYFACAVFITHVLQEDAPTSSTSTSSTSTSSTPASNSHKTAQLDYVLDSQTFMCALGRLLYFGCPKRKNASPVPKVQDETDKETKKDLPPKPPTPAESAQKAYDLFHSMSNLPPLETLPGMKGFAISHITEMAMVPVQAAIRSHYRNCDLGIENVGQISDIEFFFLHRGQQNYCDFVKASFLPSYVDLSESVLLDILSQDKTCWTIVLKTMRTLGPLSGKPNLTKGAIRDHANSHKGSIINWLFGHDGYNNLSLQEHSHVESKFKLKGTINTDGLVLHLLAYDTTIMRPKAKKQAESDHQDDLDMLDQDDEDLQFECMFDELQELDLEGVFDELEDLDYEDAELQSLPVDEELETPDYSEKDLHQESLRWLQRLDSMDIETFEFADMRQDGMELEHTNPDPSPAQPANGKHTINWKQSTKLLPNVEVIFDHQNKCPPHDSTVVIGVDPGVINTITAAKIDPKTPNSRHVVTVKQRYLYTPAILFRNLLQSKKDSAGIADLEHGIPPFRRATLAQYFEYLGSPVPADSSTTSKTVLETLLEFYHSNWYRKKRWDLQKASTACMDLAIKGVLTMAGGSEGRKLEETDIRMQRVIFCIGLGTFRSERGLPSKHSSLLKRLAIRLKSLGYTVVGAHE
ncbi:MAG: hypothetical protein J3Q66DRAFT_402029 [Benniella sp.]|nr:MAG: hypothetical protein J3Q66DRAFT_402029 [Benniella sp.]